MLAIFILWPIVVVNTELLIQWNGFKEPEESPWQFGQVSSFQMLKSKPLTVLLDSCCISRGPPADKSYKRFLEAQVRTIGGTEKAEDKSR